MRQIVYISTIRPDAAAVALPDIMATSRRNNARCDVTGLLFFDGKRFLQALEGEAGAVAATFARIRQDARHRAVVMLSDREIEHREFGAWAMALHRDDEPHEGGMAGVDALVANAAPAVRATFESFARVRRAA